MIQSNILSHNPKLGGRKKTQKEYTVISVMCIQIDWMMMFMLDSPESFRSINKITKNALRIVCDHNVIYI